VLCGHDHQEDVRAVEHPSQRVQVAVAGTITTRTRGGRPPAINVVELGTGAPVVSHRAWHAETRSFR
jgi:hypothetical protein